MPEDATLDRLLILDGDIMEVGGGYLVSIKAHRVAATPARPHGIDDSLCLIGPDDERAICFDNAHPIDVGTGPAKKRTKASDHMHAGEKVTAYDYTDAGTLLTDFWDAVDKLLKEEGIA